MESLSPTQEFLLNFVPKQGIFPISVGTFPCALPRVGLFRPAHRSLSLANISCMSLAWQWPSLPCLIALACEKDWNRCHSCVIQLSIPISTLELSHEKVFAFQKYFQLKIERIQRGLWIWNCSVYFLLNCHNFSCCVGKQEKSDEVT